MRRALPALNYSKLSASEWVYEKWTEGKEGKACVWWGGMEVGLLDYVFRVCVCVAWLGMAMQWWVSGSRVKLIADLQFWFHRDPTLPTHTYTHIHIQPVNGWPLYSAYDIHWRCRRGYLLWMRHVLLGALVMYELGFGGTQLWVLEAVPAPASFSPPHSFTHTHTQTLIVALTHVTSRSTWQLLHIQHGLSDLDAGSSASGAAVYLLSFSELRRGEDRREGVQRGQAPPSSTLSGYNLSTMCTFWIILTMNSPYLSSALCQGVMSFKDFYRWHLDSESISSLRSPVRQQRGEVSVAASLTYKNALRKCRPPS